MRQDKVKIDKDDIRTLSIDSRMVKDLSNLAIGQVLSASEKNLGASIITTMVKESGILPNGFRAVKDEEKGVVYGYLGANGNYMPIVDVDSFFNDIAAECFDYGFTPDHMAVAFEHGYHYTGNIVGSTKEGKEKVMMDVYNQMQVQEHYKGVSK